jgi:hypothetical protein
MTPTAGPKIALFVVEKLPLESPKPSAPQAATGPITSSVTANPIHNHVFFLRVWPV